MKLARAISISVLLLRLLVVSSSTVLSQSALATCESRKNQLSKLIYASRHEKPTKRLHGYTRFLRMTGDDPEGCVTTNITREIRKAEQELISVVIHGVPSHPDRILHCNEIDNDTAACRGPELDDALLANEDSLLSKTNTLSTEGDVSILVALDSGMKIADVFAGDLQALQNGKQPTRIATENGRFPTHALRQWSRPVLIVTLSSDDPLHLRKCVWFFEPLL